MSCTCPAVLEHRCSMLIVFGLHAIGCRYKLMGEALGFAFVASGPMVRSSYRTYGTLGSIVKLLTGVVCSRRCWRAFREKCAQIADV